MKKSIYVRITLPIIAFVILYLFSEITGIAKKELFENKFLLTLLAWGMITAILNILLNTLHEINTKNLFKEAIGYFLAATIPSIATITINKLISSLSSEAAITGKGNLIIFLFFVIPILFFVSFALKKVFKVDKNSNILDALLSFLYTFCISIALVIILYFLVMGGVA